MAVGQHGDGDALLTPVILSIAATEHVTACLRSARAATTAFTFRPLAAMMSTCFVAETRTVAPKAKPAAELRVLAATPAGARPAVAVVVAYQRAPGTSNVVTAPPMTP